MERKEATFEVKRAPDGEGRFEGYASVFGAVDRGADVVERGAFARSLSERKPKMLWQHNIREVIGSWEEVKEDDYGLYVKGRLFTDLPRGAEAMTLLREGEIDRMSIGYMVKEATEEGRTRKLTDLDLFEVSLVTFPMLDAARVTAVKADHVETERDFELFLRDAGFSRKEAKAIAAGGFKACQRDAGRGDETESLKALMAQLTQLKETIHG